MKIPKISTEEWALFSDFDGTLVDIADHPSAVLVTEGLLTLLDEAQHVFSGAVALISGRSLENLNEQLRNLNIAASGSHGAEWQDSNRIRDCIDFNDQQFLRYKQSIAEFSRKHQLLVEDKGFAIAIHTRGKEHLQSTVDDFIQSLQIDNTFKTLRGKAIREIKPADINKGLALHRFMQLSQFKNRSALFIGDDTTDEDAFDYVNNHQGISIKVGEGESCAHYRLASPQEVQSFLREIIEFAR